MINAWREFTPKMKRPLFCPSLWLLRKNNKKNYGILFVLFICTGIMFQCIDPFPYFFLFVALFLFIGFVSVFSERHYCKEINAIVLGTKMPSVSRYFMETSGTTSFLYFLVPMMTLLIFGIGGCSMFGALKWTVTFFWILVLFSIVVYISIIGYLQYVFLAIYIAKLSKYEERYDVNDKHEAGYVPADGEWIKRLTILTHHYRSVFFTLGAAYIGAFACFCYLPVMHADRNGYAFYALWLIIFIAIVITFPVVTLFERFWIKKIVEKQKKAYISDLKREYKILSTADRSALPNLVKSIRVRQILDSKDYPIVSLWSTGYAALLSALNLLAAIVTIVANRNSFTVFLQHIS